MRGGSSAAMIMALVYFVGSTGATLGQTCAAETGYQAPSGGSWCPWITRYWEHVTLDATVDQKRTCNSGPRQSPINLQTPAQASSDLGRIAFQYPTSGDLTLNNTGHSVEMLVSPEHYTKADGRGRIAPPGSTPAPPPERFMTVNGKRYQFDHFHFHHPSEHLLDGKRFAMELHFVYTATGTDSGRAVLGVFLDRADVKNDALDALFQNMSDTAVEDGKKRMAFTSAAMVHALPQDRTYVQYDGSLTTPGCNEDVTWRVLKTPIPISQAQIDKFKAAIKTPLGFTNANDVAVNARLWRAAGTREVKLSPPYPPAPRDIIYKLNESFVTLRLTDNGTPRLGSIVDTAFRLEERIRADFPSNLSDFTAIAPGMEGILWLGLKSDGTVRGQPTQGWQAPLPSLTNAVALAISARGLMALHTDGTVTYQPNAKDARATKLSWQGVARITANVGPKGGFYGVTKDARVLSLDEDAPTSVQWVNLSNVRAVAANQVQRVALLMDGTVSAWQSADGEPLPPAGLNGVVAITAGIGHMIALRFDGTVVGWGRRAYLEQLPQDLKDVTAIAATWSWNLASRADGTSYVWGRNPQWWEQR